jgi:hypothetical protein
MNPSADVTSLMLVLLFEYRRRADHGLFKTVT